jgi:hypothetical protein
MLETGTLLMVSITALRAGSQPNQSAEAEIREAECFGTSVYRDPRSPQEESTFEHHLDTRDCSLHKPQASQWFWYHVV